MVSFITLLVVALHLAAAAAAAAAARNDQANCLSSPVLQGVYPSSVVVGFDNAVEYDSHTFKVNATFPPHDNNTAPECRTLVVWIGTISTVIVSCHLVVAVHVLV